MSTVASAAPTGGLRARLGFRLRDAAFYGAASAALRFVTLVTTPIIWGTRP